MSDDGSRIPLAADGVEGLNCASEQRYSRRRVLVATGTAGAGLLAGCIDESDDSNGEASGGRDDEMASTDSMAGGAGASTDADEDGTPTAVADGDGGTDAGGDDPVPTGETGDLPAWRTTELTSVRADETFTVEGLDRPVLVQTFAVWCPKCRRQQEALSEVRDDATVVSLNVDANEDGDQVADHAESNGFDWRFAVSPSAVTQSMVDAFGTDVTTPPSTPIVVLCEDGDATFRSGSVMDASALRDAIDSC